MAAASSLAAYVDLKEEPTGILKESLNMLKAQGWEYEIFNSDSPNYLKSDFNSNGLLKSTNLPDGLKYVDGYNINQAKKNLNIYLKKTELSLDANRTPNGLKSSIFRTQVLVAKNNNQVIIAFRGSDNWQNWVFTDAFVMPCWFYDTETAVHTGFGLYLFEAINDNKFKEWFAKNVTPDSKFLITGHSLGAAVAVLMAAKLGSVDNYPPKNIDLITFAEPAPGQYDFAIKYNSILHNYIWVAQPIDPVVYITYPFKYYHFGIPYFLINVSESWVTHSMMNYYTEIMKLETESSLSREKP